MHHFKFYFRRLQTKPQYFFLNIGGLMVGVFSVFFIYIIVVKELNRERFHSKGADVYRLFSDKEGDNGRMDQIIFPFAPLIADKLPEVNNFVRIINGGEN